VISPGGTKRSELPGDYAPEVPVIGSRIVREAGVNGYPPYSLNRIVLR